MFRGYSAEHRAAFVEDRKAFRRGMPRLALDVATSTLAQQLGEQEQPARRWTRLFAGRRCDDRRLLVLPSALVHRARDGCEWSSVHVSVDDAMDASRRRHRSWQSATSQQRRSHRGRPCGRRGGSTGRDGQAPGRCPVGTRVTVAPTDYGIDPIAGELAAEYTNEWVVKRIDPRAGMVHVHFPRSGYQIQASEAAAPGSHQPGDPAVYGFGRPVRPLSEPSPLL